MLLSSQYGKKYYGSQAIKKGDTPLNHDVIKWQGVEETLHTLLTTALHGDDRGTCLTEVWVDREAGVNAVVL
jgi:hypothetical protein